VRTPFPISDLEIVGYANLLAETMLPSIVPPIFRRRDNPDEVFVPPYLFNGGHLCNATALSDDEISALAQNGEVTLFRGEPLAAMTGFELWLDQQGQSHYEPRAEADAHLLAIAQGHIAKAEEALRNGNRQEAERYCAVALCADDRLVDPLAIKAAIRRLDADATGEQLMAKMAAPRVTERPFRAMVNAYAALPRSAPAGAAPAPKPGSDLSGRRPMYGVAALRSA
jgi:hypothetical protein